MSLVIKSHEELIAALPHVLGFEPVESIVVCPVTSGLPFARVDLPRSAQEREEVLQALGGPYARNAGPGAAVALVGVSADRAAAEAATEHLAAGLLQAGLRTRMRLWSNDQQWEELDTGQVGHTGDAAGRVAAQMVLEGAVRPAASREAVAASLVGDRGPIRSVLPQARLAAESSTVGAEREWAASRVERFYRDGNRLSDGDAARILVAVESVEIRDELWQDVTRENALSHVALWGDLTRRAPDEARAAPAALMAFSSWLAGDGARAWCALDQVPSGQPYSMADVVAALVQQGINPATWAHIRADLHPTTPGSDQPGRSSPTREHQQVDRSGNERGRWPSQLPPSWPPSPAGPPR